MIHAYDALGEQEQSIVRAEWAEGFDALRNKLDYAAEFTSARESYSELDDNGDVLVHPANT